MSTLKNYNNWKFLAGSFTPWNTTSNIF